jgi:hypothetical protein
LLLNYGQGNLFVDSRAAVFPLAAQGLPCSDNLCGSCVTIQKEHRHKTTKYNLKYELQNQNKGVVGSGRGLLQYCQLPDKNSRDISKDTWNILQYFRIAIYLFHDFCRNSRVSRILGWETLVQILTSNLRYPVQISDQPDILLCFQKFLSVNCHPLCFILPYD